MLAGAACPSEAAPYSGPASGQQAAWATPAGNGLIGRVPCCSPLLQPLAAAPCYSPLLQPLAAAPCYSPLPSAQVSLAGESYAGVYVPLFIEA